MTHDGQDSTSRPDEVSSSRCQRHPERVSYVRCQRCGHPTCPECQRPAAVGVHCVQCVQAAAASAPTTRTSLGAPDGVTKPYLTYGIIAACVLGFVAQNVMPDVTRALAFVPAFSVDEPWRLVSHGFMHSGMMHILFNMYALFITGTALEPALGRLRFAGLYVASMVAGAALFAIIGGAVTATGGGLVLNSAVGASGAVFGLFGSLLIVQRRFGGDTTQLIFLLVINAAIGFFVPNIAWEAHLGGFLAGALITGVIAYGPRTATGRKLHFVVIGAVLVASVVACLAVAATSGL